MARDFGFDTRQLESWQRQFLQLRNRKVRDAKNKIMRKGGLRALEVIMDNTPVDIGRLRASMTFGDQDNVFLIRVTDTIAEATVGTSVYYAVFVEEGFQQVAGQFVPGEFQNLGGETIFRYIPGHDSGIVLTGKYIPGAKMFAKAVEALAEDFPEIVKDEIRRAASGVFGT